MTRLVLVHSPFVGPVAWRATADVLPAAVVADYGGVNGPDWYGRVGRAVAAQAGEAPWTAVLHSAAGGFAPALAAASPSLAGFIFIDAILPHPGRSVLETAPADLVAHLRKITTDGLLAPWNRWFDEDPTARMIPHAPARAGFIRDLPRTPFAFLEAVAPDHSAWEAIPAAYIQLTRTYEGAAERAAARGWTVRRERLSTTWPWPATRRASPSFCWRPRRAEADRLCRTAGDKSSVAPAVAEATGAASPTASRRFSRRCRVRPGRSECPRSAPPPSRLATWRSRSTRPAPSTARRC